MASTGRDVWDDKGVEEVTSTEPAAGGTVGTVTVPSGVRYLLQGWYFKVVNDAGVADRALTVNIGDGTRTLWTATYGTLTASQTGEMVGFIGIPSNDTTGVAQCIAIPVGWELPAGWTISGTYANAEAGDNFEATRAKVKILPQY